MYLEKKEYEANGVISLLWVCALFIACALFVVFSGGKMNTAKAVEIDIKPVEMSVARAVPAISVKEKPVVVEKIEPEVAYFDVPLSEDLQDHIFSLCEEYGVEPAVVMAMIERESRFKPDVAGDGGRSVGLMQIQKRWHSERMARLGVTDLYDPYQNVTVGIDLLGELLDRCKGLEWALMAYNGGPSYANKKANAGELSEYAECVIQRSGELERR